MSSEVVDALRRARALIEDPLTWNGGPRRWLKGDQCAASAIEAATSSSGALTEACYAAVRRATGCFHLMVWNDARTHAEVLAGFDAAISMETLDEIQRLLYEA